jgi:hypothetical protein
MANKPSPPPLFWLIYRHRDGRAAGAVVVESHGLLHARLMASLDRGLEFASGHQLDPESAGQIPANIIGRFLDDGDLQKLHSVLIRKRPPAPPVRRRMATKRRVGKHDAPQGRNHKGKSSPKEKAAPDRWRGCAGRCQPTGSPQSQVLLSDRFLGRPYVASPTELQSFFLRRTDHRDLIPFPIRS